MVKDEYIKDLHDNVDEHVFANTDPRYNYSRKYLGVLLEINGFFYYAPLSSPKNSDYMIMRGRKVIRNSTKSIIRMVETDANGKRSLLGTIKLSNMIPVPYNQLIDYDLDNEQDKEYKDLDLKEKRFINRNEDMITSYAEVLYREKMDGSISRGYLVRIKEPWSICCSRALSAQKMVFIAGAFHREIPGGALPGYPGGDFLQR